MTLSWQSVPGAMLAPHVGGKSSICLCLSPCVRCCVFSVLLKPVPLKLGWLGSHDAAPMVTRHETGSRDPALTRCCTHRIPRPYGCGEYCTSSARVSRETVESKVICAVRQAPCAAASCGMSAASSSNSSSRRSPIDVVHPAARSVAGRAPAATHAPTPAVRERRHARAPPRGRAGHTARARWRWFGQVID